LDLTVPRLQTELGHELEANIAPRDARVSAFDQRLLDIQLKQSASVQGVLDGGPFPIL
jgi:hypothetical protein